MSRQIGIALGVAVLVAILGAPSAGDALDRFGDGWTFMAAGGVAAALAFAAIGRATAPVAEPVPEAA
jgi:hypothetical protein